MDLSTYQIIHVAAMMLLFFAFGGITLGARTANGRNFEHRRLYIILHGLGLFGLLVSGFGQLAKLAHSEGGFPHWVIGKIVIWLCLGVVLSLLVRKPQTNKWNWLLLVGLGTLAAALGILKP